MLLVIRFDSRHGSNAIAVILPPISGSINADTKMFLNFALSIKANNSFSSLTERKAK